MPVDSSAEQSSSAEASSVEVQDNKDGKNTRDSKEAFEKAKDATAAETKKP